MQLATNLANHSNILGRENKNITEKGERIAQMIILPTPEIEIVESNEISVTERGYGGFGSTRNK